MKKEKIKRNESNLTASGFREAIDADQRGVTNGIDDSSSGFFLLVGMKGRIGLFEEEKVREDRHGNGDGGSESNNSACGSYRRHCGGLITELQIEESLKQRPVN